MLFIQRQTEANRYREEEKVPFFLSQNDFMLLASAQTVSGILLFFLWNGKYRKSLRWKTIKKCWVVEKFIINTDIRSTVHYYDLGSREHTHESHSNMLTCFPFRFRFVFFWWEEKKNWNHLHSVHAMQIDITGMMSHRMAAAVYFEFFVFRRRLNAGYFNIGFSYSVCLFRHPFYCNLCLSL